MPIPAPQRGMFAPKKEEKGESTVTEGLVRIPNELPALIKAEKIQKKAALVGFDWDDISDVYKKIEEEYKELLDECKEGNIKYIQNDVSKLISYYNFITNLIYENYVELLREDEFISNSDKKIYFKR